MALVQYRGSDLNLADVADVGRLVSEQHQGLCAGLDANSSLLHASPSMALVQYRGSDRIVSAMAVVECLALVEHQEWLAAFDANFSTLPVAAATALVHLNGLDLNLSAVTTIQHFALADHQGCFTGLDVNFSILPVASATALVPHHGIDPNVSAMASIQRLTSAELQTSYAGLDANFSVHVATAPLVLVWPENCLASGAHQLSMVIGAPSKSLIQNQRLPNSAEEVEVVPGFVYLILLISCLFVGFMIFLCHREYSQSLEKFLNARKDVKAWNEYVIQRVFSGKLCVHLYLCIMCA